MAGLWLIATALAGLNAGILLSGLLEGVYLRPVSVNVYLQLQQPRDLLLRRVMPPLLLAAMACCLGLTVLAFGTLTGWLAGVAFVLILSDVLITVRHLVPLNRVIAGYDALNPPPEAGTVRRRWYALHAARTGLGTLAFFLLLLSNF